MFKVVYEIKPSQKYRTDGIVVLQNEEGTYILHANGDEYQCPNPSADTLTEFGKWIRKNVK